MLGLEDLLARYIGENQALFMITGASCLILINLVLTMVHEIRNKDMHMDDVKHFIAPLILYILFFLTLESLTIAVKGVPIAYDLFKGLQILGFITALAKYGKDIYTKLKDLGMPTDAKIDAPFEDKLDGISAETKKEINDLVDEYLKQKEAKKEVQ